MQMIRSISRTTKAGIADSAQARRRAPQRVLKSLWLAAAAIGFLVLVSCQKDQRERIFEMDYPNIPFSIPAGLSPGPIPRALVLDNFSSNLRYYLTTYSTDTSAIGAILPLSANIRSLDDTDLDFIQEVSVRICPQGSGACTPADEVFYINDLQRNRIGSQIRLLPTLVNAKRNLSKERFKLEIWFYLYDLSPYAIPCRLDMRFEAVR
ncbi:MAG: hypothetical protein KIPDCIKN_02142 [Haliscomenobacter sp.]|jgi:hypothetical protein|nr:hypothetical protein [Haliscomenobacter sp.]